MGSGISTVCGSKRSVLIKNSVRKLPPIPENEVDSDLDDLEIRSPPGKLHPADSRDSGIGENDVPNGYVLHRHNKSDYIRHSSSESSPEKNKDSHDDITEVTSLRPSRPHSCRLGDRGHAGSSRKQNNSELSESKIRQLVRSANGQPCVPTRANGDFDSSDNDTLSCNSSTSQTRDVNGRPKSARRRLHRRRQRTRDAKIPARIVTDIHSSTDTEISDTDMLSIPDETGGSARGSNPTTPRRGWVRTDDKADVLVSPRLIASMRSPPAPYRIVSGSFVDPDAHLAKKASERSISGVVLTPAEGACSPTNSDWFAAPNEFSYHVGGNLDDLVTSLVTAIDIQRSRGPCSQSDYETLMKSLRYQLVAMAMNSISQQSTPRIEVQGGQSTLFSEDPWRVQIRLRTEDEEILETSEQTLARRLTQRGSNISREGVSILLAEHLRTIETLQHVHGAGHKQQLDPIGVKGWASESNVHLEKRRPGSASKKRTNSNIESISVLNHDSGGIPNTNKLPPIGQSQNSKLPRDTPGNQKRLRVGNSKAADKGIVDDIDSLQSSPETKAKNGRNLNESGIDSEGEDSDIIGYEEAESFLNSEFADALQILWTSLTDADLADLFAEYRKRQGSLLSSFGLSTPSAHAVNADIADTDMGQSRSKRPQTAHQDVSRLDDEFVRKFRDKKHDRKLTYDGFCEAVAEHMKKTKVIRVQSFRDPATSDNQRSITFTGFGPSRQNSYPPLKRQHTFSAGSTTRGYGTGSSSGQNSFIRSLPSSRQGSFCRTRSRGSTGSSTTYSTTSSGVSSGINSTDSERGGSLTSKSVLSRECSYGLLSEFEDIEEIDEEAKTSRDTLRPLSDNLRPPSGRKPNVPRPTSANMRLRDRRGQTQVHGLGPTPAEPLRKIEEDSMPKVEEIEGKAKTRSRPDSGIAVSTSSASYSSSEAHREADDIDEPCFSTSCQEMADKVSKVHADQHDNTKSLVAAITKGLNLEHLKAQALYCWLTGQDPGQWAAHSRKAGSPCGKLKHIHEKKTTYTAVYMEMLKVAGLRCERIEGYVKTSDYLPGNTVQSPKFTHTWLAVCMDGHYRLVDPHYGATGEKFVMDHYFATSPDALILSHFPKDKKWLLMNQPFTIEGFEGTVKTWPAMFHFQIRPLNMKSVVRTYDGRLSITVLLQDVAVNPQLEYAGPGPEIDSATLEEQIDHEIRDIDNAETYHVTLPQEGNYYFTVYAHVLEECIDVPVFQYRIDYTDELL